MIMPKESNESFIDETRNHHCSRWDCRIRLRRSGEYANPLGRHVLGKVPVYQATSLPSSQLINPEELVKILESSKGEKPLMIQVGSRALSAGTHSWFGIHWSGFQ